MLVLNSLVSGDLPWGPERQVQGMGGPGLSEG